MLFLVPGITMGLFANEKTQGTQELLFTSPITIWELVLGKYLAAAIFVSLLYWGWVWGPAGALLAVPITVMLQVIFARIERLRPLAVLLDS